MDEVEEFFDDYTFKIEAKKPPHKHNKGGRKKKKQVVVATLTAGTNEEK